MSSPKAADSTEEPKSDNTDDKERLCRDFSKGRCERKNCKYKHETTGLTFCHDFQNNYCPRPNCKFIHCSPFEEDMYRQCQGMTEQVLAEATRTNQVPDVMRVHDNFKKGICKRSSCRFRNWPGACLDETHGEVSEYRRNLSRKYEADILCGMKASVHFPHFRDPEAAESESPASKRRLVQVLPIDCSTNKPVFQGYHAGTPPGPILNCGNIRGSSGNGIEALVYLLQKEVEDLKKQVQDLTATNLFLLDQNASIRVSNNHNSAVGSSSLTNPTTAPTQQVIGTVTTGVANVPVSIATVPVSLATVPVSLATVSTCNPVTISAMPSVSIASTAQLLAPSPQILVTPSTQLALANNSQAQLTIASNAQQLAVASVPQQITLTNQGPPQLTLAGQNQQQITLTNQNQQHLSLANQNQHLALANQNQHQQQMLANQNQQQVTLSSQGQQLSLANQNQHQQQMLANQNQQQVTLSSQGQQLALANQNQHQQQMLANQNQQQVTLSSQGQQLALANQNQHQQQMLANQNQQQVTLSSQGQQLTLANQNQLALSGQSQQILTPQNLTGQRQIELHGTIQTSQPAIVSYPIVTHSIDYSSNR